MADTKKTTGVQVPRPTRKRPNPAAEAQGLTRRLMASVPMLDNAPNNLGPARPSDELKDLNFKVPPDFHTAFKLEATRRGMKMNELLKAMFDHYLDTVP